MNSSVFTLTKIKKYFYPSILNFLHKPLIRKDSNDPFHRVFQEFIKLSAESTSPSILELGSRNVTGISHRDTFQNAGNYVGFDIHAGEGVDVVGDVHKLSDHFDVNEFDFAYSVSVFEHLLFPWKAVLEINKVMRPGGYVFVSTHPVWPEHELPWDFWRFPGNGFNALFNQYTGFEIVSVVEGSPCRAYSLVDAASTKYTYLHTMKQGVSVIAKKTGDYRSDLLKWDIDVSDVVDTMYPSK